MATLRPFTCDDLFEFNLLNFDDFTESYILSYYLDHLMHWPELFHIAVAPNGQSVGYIMGRAEGEGGDFHTHTSSFTVSYDYRRLGIGNALMTYFDDISEKKRAYFSELFVRQGNEKAINLYYKHNYVIYRKLPDYYVGRFPEDAYEMRKALSRDKEKKSIVPYTEPEPEYITWGDVSNYLVSMFSVMVLYCIDLTLAVLGWFVNLLYE